MNNYKILICDDLETERRDINLFLSNIFRGSADIELTLKLVDFNSVNDELANNYDLLILDLIDQGFQGPRKDLGVKVMMRNEQFNRIPTVVYTSMGDSVEFDEDQKRLMYPSLIKKITKIHDTYSNLVDFVKGFIISNPKNKGHYSLYDDNDIPLQLSILMIGAKAFTYVMYQVYEAIGKQQITVYPMSLGFSGAVLFKLKYGTKTSILKLSSDVEALRQEHKNALELYREFPNHMINNIESTEYSAFGGGVVGVLIKNVEDAQTFFDMVTLQSTSPKEIENYLEKLYLEGNSLRDHFKRHRSDKKDWQAIFEKIDSKKLALVESALKDLKPIIHKYSPSAKIEIDAFRRVAIDGKYENLNKEKLTGENYKKPLVLSHGDFHSKNIMVQNSQRPVIIDTGLVGYKHWSLDLSRLMVNLFITGINHNNVDFYELSSIEKELIIADHLINRTEIHLDGVNDNVITALNWLTKNADKIYGDIFTLFEFQLGILKELLQVAYRIESIPPGKRALALIVAQKCLALANDSVIKI